MPPSGHFMNPSLPTVSPSFKLVRLFWIGLVVFLVGSGPYLVFSLLARKGWLDPADHARLAVWLFLPAMFTFLPGLICLVWGAGLSVFRHRQAGDEFRNPGRRPVAGGPPKFKLEGVFWYGLILFLGCSGPLLLTLLLAKLGVAKDANPNPAVFGIMAGLTFWPSMICMIGGLISAIYKHRKAKRLFAAGITD